MFSEVKKSIYQKKNFFLLFFLVRKTFKIVMTFQFSRKYFLFFLVTFIKKKTSLSI